VVIQFIEQQLITRFSVPFVLVFDNATYFSSTLLTEFALDKGIIIRYSANYYPQGNGVAESTNKNLVRILKKMVANNQGNWHNLLHNALWADKFTPKEAIGNSPYFLVYGLEAILPNELYLPSFQLSQESEVGGDPSSTLQQRIGTLLMLEEEREKAKSKFRAHQ
jgi:transposase InsO family protein